ncbi:LysE family translocator [Allosediminivita pacifica]|uniref:Threonine/homoserine/homoserine lactone efflux protein n=1 Tax=Allosediminivita pacifica TaxID=1267769 RepID=A0A2T6ABF7_9RHOB|nr:LysE family translocator [Allosediminivita pacifica]PTX41141.1 threonine/homoserine/homoserine lactone efflux protein [Allosediminivita pacifica]GGB24839.1 amino acid transporter [Allosediminivita pacifica]
MLSIYALTWLGVLAAQVSPGPNLAAVASVGIAQGRRPALCVVTGISSGMLVWSMATALGLGALIEAFPLSLLALKLVGGAYLLFLGIKAARATLRGGGRATVSPEARPLTDAEAWQRGILVLLTNPKAALMWAAVASFLFGQGLSAWHVLAFGPMGALSGLVIYGTYALLFSTGMAMRGYARFARWFEGVFAGAFGAMGASLLWAGVREARQ